MFGHGYTMGWMWVWMLLAVVGLLLFIFVIVRVAAGASRGRETVVPRQILDERYAKGELTTEEYRERLSVLSESTSNEH